MSNTDPSTSTGNEHDNEYKHDTNAQTRERRSTGETRRTVLKTIGAGAIATGLSVGSTGTAAADGIPTPWLEVDGNVLRDPDGNQVVLRGVNTIDPGRANDEAPHNTIYIEDQIDLMTNADEGWHVRLVRLPMQPQDIGDHSPGTAAEPVAFTEAQLKTYLEEHIDPAVEKCKEVGAYVIVDYHRHYPEGPDWDSSELDEEIRLFWNTVAPRYSDQSHVLYELYNEPTTPYPGAGDPTDEVGVISDRAEENYQYWRETAQPWVDLIREHAERNIVIIGSPRWSQFTYWADEYEFEGENLAYAGHVYTHENLRPLSEYFGKPSENVPVFMTEFGFQPYEGSPYLMGTRDEHGEEFRAFYEEYDSVHWTAWCFDFEWDPSMLDRDYEVDNEWGQWVQDYLDEKRDDDVPAGDGNGDGDGNDTDNPDPPAAPTDLEATDVTTTSVTLEWAGVDGAERYIVSVGGTEEQQVTDTTATIGGLESGTAYEIGVTAVDGEGTESAVATTVVETTSGSDGEGPPAINGSEPADTTGDGLYDDLTGSGSTSTTDVNVFFEHVNDPDVADYPEYYDFDGNGEVTVTDVVDLFERI